MFFGVGRWNQASYGQAGWLAIARASLDEGSGLKIEERMLAKLMAILLGTQEWRRRKGGLRVIWTMMYFGQVLGESHDHGHNL